MFGPLESFNEKPLVVACNCYQVSQCGATLLSLVLKPRLFPIIEAAPSEQHATRFWYESSCLAKYSSTLAKTSSPFVVASKFEENKRSACTSSWTNRIYTRSKALSAIVVDSSSWMANFDTPRIFINWSAQSLAMESILCLMVSLYNGTS